MIMDRDADDSAAPSGEAALLHEVSEALTALANYLSTLDRLLGTAVPTGRENASTLVGKSLVQVARAGDAMGRLRRLRLPE